MSGCSPMKSPPSSSSPPKGSGLGGERDARVPEWSEWQWQEQYLREYRSRENPVGSDKWEYDYRYPEVDDTTPRSSQLNLTGGPSDFSRSPTQGYSYASDMPRGYPPNPYQQGRALANAPYPRSGQPYDSGQPTSLSLRPANILYGGGYPGSPPGPLMTNSSGFPVGDPNTLVQTYSGGDDDDRNYAPPRFPSPYQVPAAQIRPAASPQSSDARQRSDTNESNLRISEDSTTGNGSLDPNYRVHSGKDFQFAKVFKILWAEPMGQVKGGKTKGTEVIPAKYGEDAYASIRRFVVVSAREGHCLCLPILTYGGQATKKKGVKPQDHAIVYMVHEVKGEKGKGGEKVERPKEIDNEQPLKKMPIRIKPLSPRDQLDRLSRLNYAKIYTVEYNVKVCFIGSVHEDSQKYFRRDFNLVHQPLPEDPDTQYSDEERELNVSHQCARSHGAMVKQEPEKRQDGTRSREKKEHDSSRKEKRDRHSRGKGNSRS